MIFVIEDDEIMAECIASAVRKVWQKQSTGVGVEVGGLDTTDALAGVEVGVEVGVGARTNIKNEKVRIFSNGVEAMVAMEEGLPELIFLDILLDGPDGFTLLNELVSYPDTAQIPVVIVSSLDLDGQDLSIYGVVQVLNKAKMTPKEIGQCVRRFI